MGKIISDKYASKDDPIFTGRYTISNPKASTKKPIKVNKTKSIMEITEFLNQILEKMILKNIDQWIWTHDRWKS